MTKQKPKTKITKLKIKKAVPKKKAPKTTRKTVKTKKVVVLKKPPKKTLPPPKKETTKTNQKRTLSLQKIKSKLLEEKKKVEEEIAKPIPTIDSIDVEGDETDEIQGKLLVEVSSQLKVRNLDRLRKIENAIQRIEMENYGTCDDCGEDIPEKRLEANPYVLICVGCAELREIENQKGKN